MTHRVQLDFSDAAFNELTQLKEAGKSPSNAAAIRNALAIYKWFLDAKETGGEILVRRPDGETERVTFVMPQS